MNKKSQVDPITIGIGILVLGGVLIFGYIGTHGAIQDTRYVFDPVKNISYDLLKCNSGQLPQTAIALRGGLDEIKKINYKEAKC